jgi:hypothetical protein
MICRAVMIMTENASVFIGKVLADDDRIRHEVTVVTPLPMAQSSRR